MTSRKVDLAFTFSDRHHEAAALYRRYFRLAPDGALSQLNDAQLARVALPACVEVGPATKSYLESSLQLGIWCFTGLQKIQELRQHAVPLRRRSGSNLGDPNPDGCDDCLPIVGWTAIGLDWKLHIAFKRKGEDDVVGSFVDAKSKLRPLQRFWLTIDIL